MLTNTKHTVQIEPCSYTEIMSHRKDAVNAIGHKKLAKALHLRKGNRIRVQLEKGDVAYVISNTTRKNSLYYEPEQIEYKKVTILT